MGESILMYSTRELFNLIKDSVAKSTLPPPAELWEDWVKFIEIDGRKAIYLLYYDVPSGSFIAQTRVFTDEAGIHLWKILPIESYIENRYAVPEKNEAIAENLRKGIYPNEETKLMLSQFNQMLSTFRFLSTTNSECGECPQIMPPHPDFCKNGTIIPPQQDKCGCWGPPGCENSE